MFELNDVELELQMSASCRSIYTFLQQLEMLLSQTFHPDVAREVTESYLSTLVHHASQFSARPTLLATSAAMPAALCVPSSFSGPSTKISDVVATKL